MDKQTIIQVVILSVFFISYLLFTIRYFKVLQKNIVFSRGVKIFHSVMIWLIPFVWALLLKALTKGTPGSFEVEQKEDPRPFVSNHNSMSAR